MMKSPKFSYDDVVVVARGVDELRVGAKAWIVGIFESRPAGSYFEKFPEGVVYTIEFEDGSSTEAHESWLSDVEKK